MNPYLSVVVGFATTLEELGVPYAVVGSVASSAYGEQRATADADFVVDLNDEQAVALVERLGDSHYIELASVRRAIAQSRFFNAIELASMFKLDVYYGGKRSNARRELDNARVARLAPDSNRAVRIASPEDVVVSRLRWFRQGGDVSEKQWTDVLGVLHVQQDRLDVAYLQRTADEERLADLLARAFEEAGTRAADSE